MDHHVIVVSAEEIGPDTRRILIERPLDYKAWPGQAADIAIDEDGWWDKPRPLTFRRTSDPDHLEFVVHTYPDVDPVTRRLAGVGQGDRLVLSDAWAEDIPGIYFGGWRRGQAQAAHAERQPRRARAA